MAKKIIKPSNPAKAHIGRPIFNFSLRTKYIILAVIGLIFYGNSVFNKYVLDDDQAIGKNAYVQMGFRGIPKILTNDSWASFYTYWGQAPSNQLSGGRYRPLSEIIFAIEQQFFGNSSLLPYFQHLFNIISYIACIIAIFYFLNTFLLKTVPGGSDIAFLSALLFAIHPIHTEVVANVKSLDEILSLLFITLTFTFSLTYLSQKAIRTNKQTKYLVLGTGSFLLALLSKEYAVTLVFFIPFLFYLLEYKKPLQAITEAIPYYGIFALYLLMRYNAVGFHSNSTIQDSNLLANPYMYATHIQKIATEWFVLGKYLGLLFFPYPLSYDYSYNQIPYHNFSDITVLLSILIYIGIFVWGIRLSRRKNVLSFAVFFFLFTILMISNFALDIGATMGERLVFHSSLGLVIILSYYLFKVTSKIPLQTKKKLIIGIVSVIGVVCFGETFVRNAQWKDEPSLFIHDVGVVPNSCMANGNAGWSYFGLAQKKILDVDQAKIYLDSAHKCLLQALHLNPTYYIAYNTLGCVYYLQGLPDSAKYCFDMVKKLHPYYPGLDLNYAILSRLYYDKGFKLAIRNGKIREGITYMKKALSIDSTNADIWYNMGIGYYHIQQYDSARYALIKTLQYKPDSTDAANAKKDIQDLSQMKKSSKSQ